MFRLVTHIAHGESFSQEFDSEEAADAAFALAKSMVMREVVVTGAVLTDAGKLRSTFGEPA